MDSTPHSLNKKKNTCWVLNQEEKTQLKSAKNIFELVFTVD
jgi:hypothetical protein